MKRRGFLGAIAAAIAAPFAEKAVAKATEQVYTVIAHSEQWGDFPLYEGEIGRVEGLRFVETKHWNRAVKLNEDWLIRAVENMRDTQERIVFDIVTGAR